jgi:hypothetical protein
MTPSGIEPATCRFVAAQYLKESADIVFQIMARSPSSTHLAIPDFTITPSLKTKTSQITGFENCALLGYYG